MDIFLIILAVLGLSVSYYFFRKSGHTLSAIALIISGVSCRLYAAMDPFLHPWDERYHALVAKNLIRHPLVPTLYDTPILEQDLLWVGGHIWLHKQPLTLWLISSSIYLFGNTDLAVRIPSIILSSMMIWLTYLIGKNLFNARIGLIAAFLISVNGLFIELTAGRIATDHVDICFAFFIEAGILFGIYHWKTKKTVWMILMSISIGLSILCKWLPGLIVIPVWLILSYSKKNWKKALFPLGICLAIVAAIALPWQFYIFNTFPIEAAHENEMNWRHFTEALEGRTGPFYYFINKIRINYGELIYLPLIWFFYNRKLTHSNVFFALSIWIIIPIVFFSIPLTKMQGYILFTAPALFIITAYFLENMYTIKILNKKPIIPKIILLLFIFLGIRYGMERMKIGSKRILPDWKTELLEIQNKHEGEKLVIFNCENYVEAMYYTDFIAYDKIPSDEDILKVKKAGYDYIILASKNRE